MLGLSTEGEVGAEFWIEERRILGQGFLHVHHDRQWVKLEVDPLQGVNRQLARLGNDHRNGLANVSGPTGSEHAPLRQRHIVDRRLDVQRRQVVKISGRPGGHHTRRVPRRIEVEAGNRRVGEVTS